MTEKKLFEKLNQSKILFLLTGLAMFLVMLFCNLKTNLLADDFMYCFSFVDYGEAFTPITSIGQIFPSMWAHRYCMNGRLVSHFLVQLFLLLPLPIFKLTNSLFFVLEVYLLYHIANRGKDRNLLLLCCIFGGIWAFTLNFGQVALWLTGSINYLWATLFTLLFMYVYIKKFMEDGDIKSLPGRILFVLAGFFVGAYSENCASTMIFCCVCFMLLSRFIKKQRLAPYMWLAIITALVGFFFMLSAPAEISNKSSQLTFSNLFDNFIAALEMYRRICIPFVVYIILAVIAYSRKLDRDTQLLALVLMLGSLAAVFVLTFASFFPERSAFIGTLMSIAAAAVLMAQLFDTELKPVIVSLGLICLLVAFYRGAVGVQDIIKTNYYLTENEQHIAACAQEGIMDVEVYRVYSDTGYCAIDGIGYLNTEEADTWPNKFMAAYFGVDSIIGG